MAQFSFTSWWDNSIFKKRSQLFLLILCLLLLLVRILWIGDAPFINDEPKFLDLGYQNAQSGEFMTLGLTGKRGVKYGPYTAWFYRFLLEISHDLIVVATIKTFIVSLLLLISLLWLATTLNMSYALVIPAFLSPYFWIYSRLMWDLNISLIGMAFAAYIAFIKYEKVWQLFIAGLFCVLATLTHLMCLPFVVSLIFHFVIFKRTWIFKNWPYCIIVLILLLSFSSPYYYYVLTTPKSIPGFTGTIQTFFYPFYAARFFTTCDFSYFIGKGWQNYASLPSLVNFLISVMSGLTWLPYILSFYGIYLAIKVVKPTLLFNNLHDPIIQGSVIALSTLVLHILSSVSADLRHHPHYYDGVWVYGLFFFWLAASKWWGLLTFKKIFSIYLLALSLYYIQIIGKIHYNEGTRSYRYGPTLKNQMEIAHELNQYPRDVRIDRKAFHPATFPHAIEFLQKLDKSKVSKSLKSTQQKLTIRYKYPGDLRHGGIILDDAY